MRSGYNHYAAGVGNETHVQGLYCRSISPARGLSPRACSVCICVERQSQNRSSVLSVLIRIHRELILFKYMALAMHCPG